MEATMRCDAAADARRDEDPVGLHRDLMRLAHARLAPAMPTDDWRERLQGETALALREGRFLEVERARVAAVARNAPREPHAFAAWFDGLEERGPGQHDPLFDYLADHASIAELRWFLRQEVAGEAGFDDLVALTQLRMPEQPKLELARNYWDEMGRGKPWGMHGPMLGALAAALAIDNTPPECIVWESLALANTLVGLAYNRRYAFHAVGALGAVEVTAPSRARKIVAGMDRLNLDRKTSRYFRLHATVDVQHARAWRDEVVIPLVGERPELAQPIAEGALMRLSAGARCFARYRLELGVDEEPLARAQA